jgi:nitrous oxide reductase accessory protein NosL
MKKVVVLIVAAVMLAGCSDEQKAKNLIKLDIKNSIGDYSSYDPVHFSNLKETIFLPEEYTMEKIHQFGKITSGHGYSKRYRKSGRLFKIHPWMMIYELCFILL